MKWLKICQLQTERRVHRRLWLRHVLPHCDGLRGGLVRLVSHLFNSLHCLPMETEAVLRHPREDDQQPKPLHKNVHLRRRRSERGCRRTVGRRCRQFCQPEFCSASGLLRSKSVSKSTSIFKFRFD